MQAYGSDRVRRGAGAQWVLLCPRPKPAWVARTPARTLVASAAPGAAVQWGGEYFEVVSATASGSGVRYVLEPWRDENVMRFVDVYDEASEATREEEHHAALRRETGRRTTNLLGILTGNLPGAVQERLGSELGVVPARLTLFSLILPMSFVAFFVFERVHRYMEREPPLPGWLGALALYLLVESATRLTIALSQGRPAGSAAGFVLYSLFYLVSPRRGALMPPVERASPARLTVDVPQDIRKNDLVMTTEPLLTLLTPAEQRVLAERFSFDYRRTATTAAMLILGFAVLGAATSIASLSDGGGLSPLLSLLGAAGIGLEQIVRLRALRSGPAGSVLAPLVRPLFRRLVTAAPRP